MPVLPLNTTLNNALDLKALILATILPSLRSPATRRVYSAHLSEFIDFMAAAPGRPFTRPTVMDWIALKRDRGLSASAINQALSAVKKLAYEARYAPSWAIPEEVFRGIEDIRADKKQGRKTGTWITMEQVGQLLREIPTDLTGRRDRALLAVLTGCALRRDEIVRLRPSQIAQREGRWVFADVLGKGSKYRTVPIPNGVKARLDEWLARYDGSGYLFCPVRRGGHVPEGDKPLSHSAIAYIVRERAQRAGLGHLSPHDLRRTFAKATRRAGADLDQIQETLGHSNVATTQGYVGGNQRLDRAPCDLLETDW